MHLKKKMKKKIQKYFLKKKKQWEIEAGELEVGEGQRWSNRVKTDKRRKRQKQPGYGK